MELFGLDQSIESTALKRKMGFQEICGLLNDTV